MKGLITGVLLAITSTYALAAKAEYRFYIKYNVENKRIVSIRTDKNTPSNIQEKCTEELLNGSVSRLLEASAKGKTGTIVLIYFCSH
ncbi:hypothetical protein BJD20_19690 [Acinetobacter proteolyticus]|uniref:hypothetical protein n=1 Tax=Acinetobacter proteolyticus TaxID=1776741 RepID=UPI0008634173|nr:hypothetical protein [Acinetobacter proteolyticus]OEY93955.1 hypothetical protein BJD20_19690 [Acinetobacter proteolyticus]